MVWVVEGSLLRCCEGVGVGCAMVHEGFCDFAATQTFRSRRDDDLGSVQQLYSKGDEVQERTQ